MIFRKKSLSILLCAALLSACGNTGSIQVIPQPAEVSLHRGEFDFSKARFAYDSSMDEASLNYAKGFERCFRQASGIAGEGENEVRFIYDISLPCEAYEISSTRSSLEMRASSLNGFVYAVQTLKQLLPAAIWGGPAEDGTEWTVPAMEISDSPRFSYRGLHLDCSRHMFSVEEICSLLDLMEMHKLNRFHWHLTDDQGWRIEIKSHPRLTQVGAWRDGTMVGKDFGSNDGVRYGGYYTQEELHYVVEYAAARGITIVPEIDLPGHTQAVIAAYPELGCNGGPFEVLTKWGVSDDVICAGNDKVFEFLEDVLDEICEIFPSEYIHIGGDEARKDRWKVCPKCQARIKAEGLKDEAELQSWFIRKIENYLNSKGRRIIGWDEILEGGVTKTATGMSWRGTKGGIEAARLGNDVIMTPSNYCYLDWYQTADPAGNAEPLAIGGWLPLRQCYSFDPYDQLTLEQRKYIKGVQCNLWTEYIPDYKQIQHQLLPRLAAIAEVAWSEDGRTDYDCFVQRVKTSLLPLYNARNYNYANYAFQNPPLE